MPVRLEPPQGTLVTLDEVKAHCRVDTSDEDFLFSSWIVSATALTAGRIGRILAPTSGVATFDAFAASLFIPIAPLRSVTSVIYRAADNNDVTIASDDYEVVDDGENVEIRFRSTFSQPSVASIAFPVSVSFSAGYDSVEPQSDPALLSPDPLDRQMVFMLVKHWDENRAAVSADGDARVVPLGFDLLVALRRIYR